MNALAVKRSVETKALLTNARSTAPVGAEMTGQPRQREHRDAESEEAVLLVLVVVARGVAPAAQEGERADPAGQMQDERRVGVATTSAARTSGSRNHVRAPGQDGQQDRARQLDARAGPAPSACPAHADRREEGQLERTDERALAL